LLAVCVATFMLLVDITIVNVALPSIQQDLDASLTNLQWVVDAYALMLSALMLTVGSLADRVGRRLVFMLGVFVFTVASLLCGLAPTATTLDLARGLQGVGGAAMFATSLALIAQEFRGREFGTAIAAWGSTVGAAVAAGPPGRWARWSAERSPRGSAGSGSSSSTCPSARWRCRLRCCGCASSAIP